MAVVSHHPPVTAFYIENKKAGVVLNGYSGQKTRILNATLVCDQTGHEVVTLSSRNNETYLFTSPALTIRGIWYAAPYVELIGTTCIQASTGYYASIEYSSRGWISGEKNHFRCLIRKNDDALKDILYKIEGQWSGKSSIIDYKTKESRQFLDTGILESARAKYKPFQDMGEMETHRIWQKVSEAIRNNDSVLAGTEKSNIENQKRAEEKERRDKGLKWEPHYFEWVDNEPQVEKLRNMLNQVIRYKGGYDAISQNGNWILREERKKYKN
ncbi:hypothetical protein HPULCUR_005839 [Helicostylum pulchrum]|uniref:Uncharacterized protein n=1 Tax=Helicostylum pulchrum TaxID=562976 RepID=A0ABP9Y075_9FUNG